MTEKEIRAWLRLLGLKALGRRRQWVVSRCPLAPWRHQTGRDRKPSFGIAEGPGESRTHCFACHFSGRQGALLAELQMRGAEVDLGQAWAMVEAAEAGAPLTLGDGDFESAFLFEPEEHPFPEEMREALEPAYARVRRKGKVLGRVHPYLRRRRVPYSVAKRMDLRYDPWRLRLVFPVRDWRGVLMGLHGRITYLPPDDDPHPPPVYLMYPCQDQTNPHVWLGEHWTDPEQPVVVAESVFDLARVIEAGFHNAISPLTADLSAAKLARIESLQDVVTIFDEDQAGRYARGKLDRALRHARVRHVYLDEGTDAGELPPDELRDLIADA